MKTHEADPAARSPYGRAARVSLALLLAMPAVARAQDIELSLFTGWRYGGSGRSQLSFREVDIEGARSIGGAAIVPVWGRNAVGLYFSRARADARSVLQGTPLEVTVSYLLAGIVHDFRPGAVVRPFVGFSLGAAWQSESPGGTRSQLTGAAVAGVRLFPTRRLGLRADARVQLLSDERFANRYYRSVGGARLTLTGDSLIQAEVAIGLVVAF